MVIPADNPLRPNFMQIANKERQVTIQPSSNSRTTFARDSRGPSLSSISLALFSAAAICSLHVPYAVAQSLDAVSQSAAVQKGIVAVTASESTTCLTRAVQSGNDKGKKVSIEVASDKVQLFLNRGFGVTTCDKQPKAISDKQRDICAYEATNDPAINANMWSAYGVTPRESCRVTQGMELSP